MANNHKATVLATESLTSPSDRPLLHLTQSEVEDFDLLCYSLGSGRNACINFATKYLCSLWLYSTLAVKLPRVQKPSKSNPPLAVEYRLNPEVLASVRAVRSRRKELEDTPEAEIARPAILYLCKKLLPPKNLRIVLSHGAKRGVS
jgi:hypothetical protein